MKMKGWVWLVGVVVVIAMGVSLWRYLSKTDVEAKLVLESVQGQVVVRTLEGAAPGRVGRALQPNDQVSTGQNGEAVMTMGASGRIRLDEDASISVVSIDEAGVRLELENGALQATVRPDSGGALRIGHKGREVLATNSEFDMGVRGGVLQVRANRGALSLSGVDQPKLQEGEQATVIDRHADIGRVPAELLLAVDWPTPGRTNKKDAEMKGTTSPGAQVLVKGAFGEKTVTADNKGVFAVTLPLVEGGNAFDVSAMDVLGNETAVTGTWKTLDTKGPKFRAGVEYPP